MNHRKTIVDKIYAIKEVMIDIPYDFNVVGTWLETTSKTVGKPLIKNVINEVESELVDYKGKSVSLYIPSLYQESNIIVLKDGEKFDLPIKNSDNKYIFTEAGIYQVTVTIDLENTSIITFEVEEPRFKNAEEAVEKAEGSNDSININGARDLVNNLPECTIKDELQDRLNNIFPDLTLESKNATANLDLYIKSENMLLLSLDTNSITFEDFSGVEDMEKQNAINLTVNSSLPYKINAYLATEIQNSDGSNMMDKDILNIRVNGESNYNTFIDTTTPIVLLDDQPADNDVSHGIDIMLKGNIAHEKDIYKTTIKFEAEQK